MAVPIKSNNTQQGCNPISSNCVVWQGPNIPCINLCTGDSVSDVVAKMATELCEIADQLDISLLDLSCFNPLCPTPQNFRDVMQLIIDKICALENPNAADGGITTSGCPSDCEIAVAPCLQYTDNLGNTVTSLPIKDYVILIGNRICTILTSIANLQTQIDALDVRVTNLENGSGGGSGSSSFNVTSDCLVQSSVSLQEYINLLDAAFCELQANSGTQQEYISAVSAASCVTGGSVQMAAPPALMGSYTNPQWIAQPSSSFEQIQNLWVAICDIRTGLINLQAQLDECCAPEVPCPVNLPRPTFQLDKDALTNDLFFVVSAGGGATISPSNTSITISGEEWRLVRFEGTVVASASGSTSVISVNLPVSPASQVYYDGSTQNKLTTIAGIANSLGVTTTGTFYWKNLTTDQECAVTASNNGQAINNPQITVCPLLWNNASPNITYAPYPLPTTCGSNGQAITITLGNFLVVNGPGVTGTAFVSGTLQYTNTSGATSTTTITLGTIGGLTTTSYALPVNAQCSSTVSLTITGVSQNGVSRTCNISDVININDPAPGL